MHPRSLLDELLRLGLARLDADTDSVCLVRDGFVPQGDQARMLQVLGRNVGAHLEGAVDNVLHDSGLAAAAPSADTARAGRRRGAPAEMAPTPTPARHFEQAIFASGLSEASLEAFRQLVTDQWQATLQAVVPALEALIARDAAQAGSHPPAQATYQQVRLGLYTHARPQADPPPAAPAAPTEPPDAPDAAP